MKILAADTAAKTCSVAVTDDGTVVCELTVNHQSTHAKFLMKMISQVLETAGLSISNMDGFAVTIGPGSFTGLRIGISSFKGFAVASGKPIVGVSSLEALAYQCYGVSMPVCAMLDARKNEVYAARYRFRTDGVICELQPSVLAPSDALEGIDGPCLFAGDGAVLYKGLILEKVGKKAVFARPEQHFIRAGVVAGLAGLRFSEDRVDDPATLVPFYIRKSDAEKSLILRADKKI